MSYGDGAVTSTLQPPAGSTGGQPALTVSEVLPPPRSQFYRLDLRYLASLLYGESQHGAHDVPSVVSAGTGVHMKNPERRVTHDLEYVGVAADEQSWAHPAKFLLCPPVVIAGIPANVCHVDVDALALPEEILGHGGAEFRPVNVP